jgi:hypothetical protein
MSQWPGKGLGGALQSSGSGSGQGPKLDFLDHARRTVAYADAGVRLGRGLVFGFAESRGRRGHEGYK